MENIYPNSYDSVVSDASKYNAWTKLVKDQEDNKITIPYSYNVTEVSQTPSPQVQIQQPKVADRIEPIKARNVSPKDVVSSFYGSPPHPTYDKDRQARISKIAKVNAITEGLRTLGDIFALSKGANVVQRQPNMENKNLYAAWQGYEDAYAGRMDEYNRSLFNQKLQSLYQDRAYNLQKDQLNRQESRDRLNQSNMDRQFDAMNLDRIERREIEKENQKLREQELTANIQARKENTKQGWAQIGIAQQRADSDSDYKKAQSQGAVTEDKNTIILSGATINDVVKIDKRYRDKLLALIVNDKLLTSADLDLLAPRMGQPVTSSQKDYIIAKYWQQSPSVNGWLSTEEAGSPAGAQYQYFQNFSQQGPATRFPYRNDYTPQTTGSKRKEDDDDPFAF